MFEVKAELCVQVGLKKEIGLSARALDICRLASSSTGETSLLSSKIKDPWSLIRSISMIASACVYKDGLFIV